MKATRFVALVAVVLTGCYQASIIGDDSGPSSDTGPLDAGGADAFFTTCPRWGHTIACDDLCDQPCPTGMRCAGIVDLCRACEGGCSCSAVAGYGATGYCRDGDLCAIPSDDEIEPGLWQGSACVDPAFCPFAASGGAPAFVGCRYSDGTPFVDGPPDHECAPGAHPDYPFCGGRCASSCEPGDACVGISEDRGFGVCALTTSKCRVDDLRRGVSQPFVDCEEPFLGHRECACFVPRPAVRPEFEGEAGWMVSLQSCLAYRERYPDHVSCLLRGANEAPR